MKLINKTKQKGTRQTAPYVRFSTKGVITLSKNAMKKLNLNGGEGLSFFQDSDNPSDWYIGINCHFEKVIVRVSNSGNGVVNSSSVCADVIQSISWPGKSANIPLAGEPSTTEIDGKQTSIYALITRNAK